MTEQDKGVTGPIRLADRKHCEGQNANHKKDRNDGNSSKPRAPAFSRASVILKLFSVTPENV
jgi:hypothetical protein